MSISKKLRFAVLQRDGFRCRYCGTTGQEERLEVDHVMAVANGGPDYMVNLVTSCRPCNQGKKHYPLPLPELKRLVLENRVAPQRRGPPYKPFSIHPGPHGPEHIADIMARAEVGPN